jgi:hypothetical protein
VCESSLAAVTSDVCRTPWCSDDSCLMRVFFFFGCSDELCLMRVESVGGVTGCVFVSYLLVQ